MLSPDTGQELAPQSAAAFADADELTFELDLSDLVPPPPSDTVEIEEWLTEREEWLSGAAIKAMGSLLKPALNKYAKSLTAAGNPDVFDGLTQGWERFVDKVGSEYLAAMHMAGGISTAQAAAQAGVVLTPEFAEDIAEWSQEYLDEISIQLAGYGDEIIEQATQQATLSLTEAATTSALQEGIAKITFKAQEAANYAMRNEVIAGYNRGHMTSARSLGEDGPAEKTWLSTRDARTRPDHLAALNQTVLLDQPFSVGGEALDAPHDPAGSPAQIANCRCTVLFLYPGDKRPDGTIVPGEEKFLERTQAEQAAADQASEERALPEGAAAEQAAFEPPDIPTRSASIDNVVTARKAESAVDPTVMDDFSILNASWNAEARAGNINPGLDEIMKAAETTKLNGPTTVYRGINEQVAEDLMKNASVGSVITAGEGATFASAWSEYAMMYGDNEMGKSFVLELVTDRGLAMSLKDSTIDEMAVILSGRQEFQIVSVRNEIKPVPYSRRTLDVTIISARQV